MAVRNGASDDAIEGQMLSHFSALSQPTLRELSSASDDIEYLSPWLLWKLVQVDYEYTDICLCFCVDVARVSCHNDVRRRTTIIAGEAQRGRIERAVS